MANDALPAPVVPKTEEDILALAYRACKGDQRALTAIRELLKNPATVDPFGDLARKSQLTLINNLAGKNLLLKESLYRKLELLRAELQGPTPTPLERLLVERIVSCWLHLHHLEQIAARVAFAASSLDSGALPH